MHIVFTRPPMFDEINAAFHVAGKPVIFAWGETIHNPARIHIAPELIVHEAIHGARQRAWGIEQWWKDYISNAYFRLDEEVHAHRAEYAYLRDHALNRRQRRGCLRTTAKRLAAPLYGKMVPPGMAKKLLLSDRTTAEVIGLTRWTGQEITDVKAA